MKYYVLFNGEIVKDYQNHPHDFSEIKAYPSVQEFYKPDELPPFYFNGVEEAERYIKGAIAISERVTPHYKTPRKPKDRSEYVIKPIMELVI